MRAFSKRYFVWISLIFLGFSGISFNSENLIFFVGFLIFLALFCLIFRKRLEKRRNFKVISLCLLIAAALGVLSSQLLIFKNDKMLQKYGGEHTFCGYVTEVSSLEEYSSEYVVRVERLDGERVSFNLLLVADYKAELERGDFFEYKGEIIKSDAYRYAVYLRNNNQYDYPLACELKEGTNIERLEDEFRISLMLTDLNSRLSARLSATMGSKNGALASALLLGNRELLKNHTLHDFKRAGVYHLLALSGLHVAILIGILEWLLKKILVPTKIRIVILATASLFYIALTGFALSACRSMLMLWIVYVSLLIQRQKDVMTSLFIAVSLIVLLKPSAALDVGLQLSFLSTFGVICATIISSKLKLSEKKAVKGIKERFTSLLRKIAIVCISSLSVFICTLPVVMICFGEVSLATFVSNFFMGVVCEAFMILSLITLIFAGALAIYPVFSFLACACGNAMTFMVECISNIENVMLSLNYPMSSIFVWVMFIAFILMLAIRLEKRWLIFAPSVALALCMIVTVVGYNHSRADFVRAEYYYGDGIVLSSNEGVYVCDMSDGAYGKFFEGAMIAKENCFTEIDGVILSHYHSDHVVYLQRFISSFTVRGVYLPKPQNEKEYYNMSAIVRICTERGVNAYLFESGEELDILSGKLILSERAYSSHYAHPGVALTYARGESRITLIGKPYFDSYLENSGKFDKYIEESDYLIFGSDGRAYKESFEIFARLDEECEVSFADTNTFLLSDYEWYLETRRIYFDVHYKKYDLK